MTRGPARIYPMFPIGDAGAPAPGTAAAGRDWLTGEPGQIVRCPRDSTSDSRRKCHATRQQDPERAGAFPGAGAPRSASQGPARP